MNPASTIKLLTTLAALDLLGPQYRWNTNLYTDGQIKNGLLKGNLYLRGSGDPKLVPEELEQMMKSLRALGIQRIDGNLIFDRSAYSPEVMEHTTIDGESIRAYNVPPDPLLYAFRTLSFQLNQTNNSNGVAISYTPALAYFKINNRLRISKQNCDDWQRKMQFELIKHVGSESKNSDQLSAQFTGELPSACKSITYNVVALDANTFLTLGFAAAWELAGGSWVKQPQGKNGEVPLFARPLLEVPAASLRAWLLAQGHTFVEDPSNSDERYTRNLIRARLLPALHEAFPAFRSTFARSAAHAAQAQSLLDEVAAQDLAHIGVPPRIEALQRLSRARQALVLRHWLRQQHATTPSTAQMNALLDQLTACTTRGHRIHLKVGVGFVQRDGQHLSWQAA